MASGVILQEITADDRKLLAAYARDKAALEKNTIAAALGAKKQNEATNKVIEQWKKLGLTKKQITQLGITGDQQQSASMKKLLGAQKVETRKVEAAYRSLGMTARQAHLMAKDGTTKQTAALRRLIAEQNVAKASHLKAFGASAVSQLKSYGAGFIGITAGIMGIAKAFNAVEEAKNSAVSNLKSSRSGIGKLKQLAETDEEFNHLVAESEKLRRRGAVDTLEEGANLTFMMASAGDLENLSLYADLNKSGLLDAPEDMARGAVTMKKNFGVEETGTSRDLINKALGASKHSITSAEELLLGSSKMGTSASLMGMSDEEIFAAQAVLASAKGSGEEGATYGAQMLRSMEAKGNFKGKGLKESLLAIDSLRTAADPNALDDWFDTAAVSAKDRRKLAAAEPEQREIMLAEMGATNGMDAATMKEFWGRAQGQQAFEILLRSMKDSGEHGYDNILADVNKAQAEDTVGIKMGFGKNTPALIAAEQLREAEGQWDIATRETIAAPAATADAEILNRKAATLKGGGSELEALAGAYVDSVERKLRWVVPGGGGDKGFNEREGNTVLTGLGMSALPGGAIYDVLGLDDAYAEASGRRGMNAPSQNQPDASGQPDVVQAIERLPERMATTMATQGGRRSSVVGLGRPELDR